MDITPVSTPPRVAAWLLQRLLPAHAAEAITGDLEEVYRETASSGHRALRADLWYWGQTLRALTRMTAVDATGELAPVGTIREGGIAPHLVADLRHALRLIRRTPLFTAVCVALFGIGIGTNAAIVLFLDSQITHPLPGVPDARSLFNLEFPREARNPADKQEDYGFLFADEWHLIDGHMSTMTLTAASSGTESMRIDNGQTVNDAGIAFVSSHYFEVLRPPMMLGPIPGPFTDTRQVVVSYAYWRTHLASDPAAVGRILRVNQVDFTIAGVAGQYFRGGNERAIDSGRETEVWMPHAAYLDLRPLRGRQSSWASKIPELSGGIIGRPAPGVTPERATAEVNAMARSIGRQLNTPGIKYGYAEPVGTTMLARLGELPTMLVALPVLVLLVACSNVSILLLGRGVTRRREIAVRLALGANRRRVVRLLLVESICLGVLGAIAGVFFAWYATRLLSIQYPQLFGTHEIAIGWRTVLGALVLAVGTGIAFGVLPALHSTRTSLYTAMKSADSGEGRHRSSLQRFFVIAEMALSMGMVCVTGLVLTHIYPAVVAPPGLDISERTVTTSLTLPRGLYSPSEVESYLGALRERLLRHPEVEVVSTVDRFPIDDWRYMTSPVASGLAGTTDAVAGKVMIDPDYFSAMRIPLQSGRDFTTEDRPSSPPVVIISAAIADRLWPGVSPVGQQLRMTGTLPGTFGSDTAKQFATVVGVAATHGLLDEDRMDGLVYFPRRQLDYQPSYLGSRLNLIIRTRTTAIPLLPVLQEEIAREDPAVVLTGLLTTAAIHEAAYASTLATAQVGLVGGLVTLLMACVGVYAVIAFGIGQRTREIGLRMALGARPAQVVRLFFLEGFHLAFSGFGLGVPIAIAGVMVLEAGDKSPAFLSPPQVAGIVVLLLVVAMLASWLPARLAARIDPMQAMRSE